VKTPLLTAIADAGKKNWQILWPLRIALAGEEFSPGAFELAYILGRDESVKRIKKILE
jgi:glutamyl/glutaminyl-tRNA synthetase